MLTAALRRIARRPRRRRSQGEYAFLAGTRGVIHAGANSGQERGTYDQHGLRVIWVDPNREVFQKLLDNIRPFPRQRAFERLLAGEDGVRHKFRVANNDGLSSSILDLKLHRESTRFMKVEGADFESYAGCCRISDVSSFLAG